MSCGADDLYSSQPSGNLALMHPFIRTSILAVATFATVAIHAQDAAPKGTVAGKFLGNGKEAKLAFASAHAREPFSDKEAITLVFTEKDHSAAKKPDFYASFGKFGSSLTISIHMDGSIFGCQVAHTGLKKPSFSASGVLKMSDFKIADGIASGSLSTGGPDEFFGDKWDVDIKFTVPVPAKAAAPMPAKPADKPAKAGADDAPEKAPTGPRIAARSLPLPTSAAGVEYKQIVGHITFTSPQSVEAVAKEFSASLKKQGWKDGAGNLVTKKSAILKRENGAAKLTIMIKPAATGSSAQIFTEGLDWDAAGAAPAPKATTPDAGAIEDEANKLLENALKQLPK